MSGKAMVLLLGNLGATPTSSPIKNNVIGEVSRSNSIMELIKLIFILILILVAAYFTTKYIGKISMGQLKNSNFKVIDTYRISSNKLLQIVKIGNKFVVISVGKDAVNFITELDESEVFVREDNAKESVNFKQILEKMRNKTDGK